MAAMHGTRAKDQKCNGKQCIPSARKNKNEYGKSAEPQKSGDE
jgi:hypothetical protein